MAKLLNNVQNGERQRMEINTPLPSYAVIDGTRVKLWQPGQKRTCARCTEYAENCSGQANAKICEANGMAWN